MIPGLSSAQHRVLELLLEGLQEKIISKRLGKASNTIHSHVREIYRHLRVHSHAELLAVFLKGKPPETN